MNHIFQSEHYYNRILQIRTSFFFNRRYISVVRVLAFSTTFFHSFLFCIIFIQFITFINFKSFITSSSHLFFGLPNFLEAIGFHLKTFLTKLCSDILFIWPNHPNLSDFIWFIIFLLFISLFNSLLFFILQVPSLFLVGSKILLNIALSNIKSF